MIIQNKEELSTSELRKEALEILESGIERVSPKKLLDSVRYDSARKVFSVKRRLFKIKGRIFVIGGGKASGLLAKKLEEKIPDIEAGIVSCKEKYELKKIKCVKACHPVPCWKSIKAAKDIFRLKEKYKIGKDDLVICLISGGASSLLVYPVEEISFGDKKKIDNLLIDSEANINEINIVRKHLSEIKGGNLAKWFFPTKIISLILSDVVGDDLGTIGSGLTVEDHSTYGDAYEILKRYDLIKKSPKKIIKYLQKGIREEIEETPKRIYNAYNFLIGNNSMALKEMKAKAESLGFNPYVISGQKGDCIGMAEKRLDEIMKGKYKKKNAIIIGGETTLKVPESHGKGGRNQHYALVSLNEMIRSGNEKEIVVASMGSDGSDFMKGAAGAIVDKNSAELVKKKNIEIQKYLRRYDSYGFFKKLGNSLIRAYSTGTNVSDIILYLIG